MRADVGFLLDTNVVSELRRAAPHPQVLRWRDRHQHADMFLSVLVVGELRQGVERLRPKDPARAALLDTWLDGLIARYASRILPVTAQVAQEWGRLNVPPMPPAVDGLIAATARVHNLILVTRNTSHVARTGVAVVNPFEAS